jgi:imidazolonepropionase-like amidohydrolase
VESEGEARAAVREQIARRVDFIKIWVDDRNRTVTKLSPELQRAVIDEAHKNRTRVIAHVFYLDDAKDLARAGVDGFAHLVRDREIDEELVGLIREHHIFVMPNMAISENAAHDSPPAWLDDPLLRELAPMAVIERARAAFLGRSPTAVERGRKTWADMKKTLAKLNVAGATIGFGTDDGAVRDHFYAFSGHRELGLMVESGMTPGQALTAATVTSASFLKMPDHGTLEVGKAADFVVLDGNPLESIENTRKIAAVYLKGERVEKRFP